MGTRSQGQHKSEFDKAKEQMERQDLLVTRLIEKIESLRADLEQHEDELLVADELLQYYKSHPVLKVDDRRQESQIRDEEPEFTEPELPLGDEKPQVQDWKGFTGRAVRGTEVPAK